jgi:hypothetical protein
MDINPHVLVLSRAQQLRSADLAEAQADRRGGSLGIEPPLVVTKRTRWATS